MKYKPFFALLVIFCTALLNSALAQSTDEPATLRNTLNVNNGADPWLTYYDGYYYLATTTWTSQWFMRRSETLAGLKTAEPIEIYFETDPSRCCNFWAPEFHLLEGPDGPRWYFYYTAGTAGTLDNQRTHVLESAGTDPLGPYTYKARIFDPFNDVWMIDGSVLTLNDELYFLFSSSQSGLQSIFIAPMSDPWTISGARVLLSQPEFRWEQMGGFVNEAPVALQHGDDTFIVYSASACWTPDYKLGMLTYNGGDPLDPVSWEKSPEPVFQRSDENGVFAPGHNGFFTSPDGSESWIVYHANDSTSGACDGGRRTRVQQFTWNEDGTPNFGTPVSSTEEITAPSGDSGVDPLPEFESLVSSRFRTFSFDTGYLRHDNFTITIDLSGAGIVESEFVVRTGLADEEAVSIEALNFPGYFLRHRGNVIELASYDGTESFAGDVTWWFREGLADSEWISIESYNQPGFYIGRQFNIVALVEDNERMTDIMREDATFFEEH